MGVFSHRPGVPCAGVRDGRVSEVLGKDSGRSVWNLVGALFLLLCDCAL